MENMVKRPKYPLKNKNLTRLSFTPKNTRQLIGALVPPALGKKYTPGQAWRAYSTLNGMIEIEIPYSGTYTT